MSIWFERNYRTFRSVMSPLCVTSKRFLFELVFFIRGIVVAVGKKMCTQIDEDVLLKPIGKEDSKKGVQAAVNKKKGRCGCMVQHITDAELIMSFNQME